jgi:hypothetical protein
MSLELIKTSLVTAEAQALNWRMSLDAWATDQSEQAAKVVVFRNYAGGDHDAKLTRNMKEMLRIGNSDFDRFNDNYMDIVIQTLVDRLRVTGFETQSETANQWIIDLMNANRFDALQTDTHEAAIRDGNTYLLVSWDKAEGRVLLTHEPAWDGSNGMMIVPDPRGRVQLGIKCWHEQLGAVMRVTLYYADHIERYISHNGGVLTPYEDEEGPAVQPFLYQNRPIGCPVIHIPNRGTTWNAYGQSEIENAIPLQNALNRTLTSMVMTAELSSFVIRWAKGFKGPSPLTPGMWINIGDGHTITKDEVVDLGVMEQGEILPFIQQAEWLTSEIGKITRTPAPEFMGSDTASGEALKQREIGLIGKAKRFQVKAGNRWEDAIKLAWRVQAALGSAPPVFDTITSDWADVELRNDKVVVENAKILHDMGHEEEALRQMAGVFDWDEAKIKELMEKKMTADQTRLSSVFSNMPTFNEATFGVPTETGNGQGAAVAA